jgi:hypothetical protein
MPSETMRARFRLSKRRCMKFPPIMAAFTIMKASRNSTRNRRGRWKASAASMATVMTRRIPQVIQ